MVAGSMVEADFKAVARAEIRGSMDRRCSMGPRRRMSSLVAIPARSEALIVEELREDSLLAGNRASVAFTATDVEDFTVAAVTRAGVIGNSGEIHGKRT
jgi:hypothetical protein